MMIVYQFLVSLEVFKGVDDELLGWVIMICDIKIFSFFLLLLLLSIMLIKSIVIMLVSKKSVMDEFWYVQELRFVRVSCS